MKPSEKISGLPWKEDFYLESLPLYPTRGWGIQQASME